MNSDGENPRGYFVITTRRSNDGTTSWEPGSLMLSLNNLSHALDQMMTMHALRQMQQGLRNRLEFLALLSNIAQSSEEGDDGQPASLEDVMLRRAIQLSMEATQPQGPPPATSDDINNLRKKKVTPMMLYGSSSQTTRCAVCLDDFIVGAEVTELPCRHFFCCSCVRSWLEMHRTCPVCRTEILNVTKREPSPPPAPITSSTYNHHSTASTHNSTQAHPQPPQSPGRGTYRLREEVSRYRPPMPYTPSSPNSSSIVNSLRSVVEVVDSDDDDDNNNTAYAILRRRAEAAIVQQRQPQPSSQQRTQQTNNLQPSRRLQPPSDDDDDDDDDDSGDDSPQRPTNVGRGRAPPPPPQRHVPVIINRRPSASTRPLQEQQSGTTNRTTSHRVAVGGNQSTGSTVGGASATTPIVRRVVNNGLNRIPSNGSLNTSSNSTNGVNVPSTTTTTRHSIRQLSQTRRSVGS